MMSHKDTGKALEIFVGQGNDRRGQKGKEGEERYPKPLNIPIY